MTNPYPHSFWNAYIFYLLSEVYEMNLKNKKFKFNLS